MLQDVATLQPLLDAPCAAALSEAARDLLRSLLRRAPEARPTAAEALQHPFFAVHGLNGDECPAAATA